MSGAKGNVAERRELFRAVPFVIRQAEPLMHNQHPGALAGAGVVIRQKTFQRRVPLFVFDVVSHNFGRPRNGPRHRQQGKQHFWHGNRIIVSGKIASGDFENG